jgi:nucleoside-diphosphate-sugar epimerase
LKIAITGANGFLGSRITWTALRGGHEVIALVRRGANLNKLTLHKKLHILEINYNAGSHGIEDFDKILKQHGTLDLFIHNAGLTVSQVEDQYFQVNANLTRQIIKTLEQQKVIKPKGKLVYISSYAAHGPFGADEPVSAYGSSKRQAECIIEESQINHTIIRPTAIYGPGDDAFLPSSKLRKEVSIHCLRQKIKCFR